MGRGEEKSDVSREEEHDVLGVGDVLIRPSRVPHYGGDTARQFMLAGAALLLFAAPLYGDDLRSEFPYEVAAAVVTVAFAALTTPRKYWVSMGSAVVCAAIAISYAVWGIGSYQSTNPTAFVLRIAVAAIFLFAFYFSMKTVRAFSLGQVGQPNRVGDLEERDDVAEDSVEDEKRQLAVESEKSGHFTPWR